MSYNSKYKGSEVENLLGKAGTAIQEHQDISHLASKAALENLQSQFNALVGNNAKAAIESFNEIIAFLAGVEDTETLEGIIAAIEQQIANKQNNIADLETIRSGASKGATAVQPSELSSVAKSGSYNDLSNKPTIPSAVTESTVSGWGFTKNTGTYSKPSGGIPNSDLAKSSFTISGTSVSLGGSITQSALRTALGLGSNAYSSTSYMAVTGGDFTGQVAVKYSSAVTLSPNTGIFIVGNRAGNHIAFDGDDIQAKTNGTTAGNLFINYLGGNVNIAKKGNVFLAADGGKVGIGTTSPSHALHAVGNIHATGSITQDSDINKKNIFENIELSIDDIAEAPLFRFSYKSDKDNIIHVGTSAQYWGEMNDWFCRKGDDDCYIMEIQSCALASAISIAREFKKYKEDTDRVIKELKEKVEMLNK